MEIYLIRHTTPAIEKGLIYGRMDVPLAASFEQEKEVVLKQLPSRLDAIYSSPSKRCCALADILSARYMVNGYSADGYSVNGCIVDGQSVNGYGADRYNAGRYRIEEDLYEMNFGSWEGETWDTIDRAESERWMEDFVHLSPPGGESMLLMQQRVMQCWNRITQASHHQVAVVTHGGVIRIILAHYSSMELRDSFAFKVGLGSVFKLRVAIP